MTSLMDSPTTVVLSNAMWYLIPGGNRFESRSSSAFASLSTVRALAPGNCEMPKPTASWPLNRKFEL